MFLDERLIWKYDSVAFALILTGSITVVQISTDREEHFTPDEMFAQLTSTNNLIYYGLYLVALTLFMQFNAWHQKQLQVFASAIQI